MPVLTLDDGTVLAQSNSILRYVCAKYKGRNGESLYPGAKDPMLSYKIDNEVDWNEDFNKSIIFMYMKKFGTPEFDESFKQFILKDWPEYLEKFEKRITNSKFIVSDQLTMADFVYAARFFMFAWNDEFELCHILQSIVERYPKVKKYVDTLLATFKFWLDSYSLKKPNTRVVVGYWKIRGLAASMRYQLEYSGVKYECEQYEQGDAPGFSREVWFS
jgi:glutathione S-transferase